MLAVDLGTTYSAAAVGDGDLVRILELGGEVATMPSVVTLREDGTMLVGEAAERRAPVDGARTAREFKRRLGDPTPFFLGGTPYGAEALMARVLSSIVDAATEREGEAPARVVLSHPAGYGPYKLDLLRETADLAGLSDVDLVTEPVAAAIHYSSLDRLPSGDLVAVYDFGGGTFDAALLRSTDDGFEPVGRPAGMDRLGGADFDMAVMNHVQAVVGDAVRGLDQNDPAAVAGLARLREDCRRAKEALSVDVDADVAVMLPGLHTEVRITRAEFEDAIRPRLRETLDVFDRMIGDAHLGYRDLSRVLLVGGSSRIPLVAEMVEQATGCPVALDTHPKQAVALGAAASALVDGLALSSSGAAAAADEPAGADGASAPPSMALASPELSRPERGARRIALVAAAVVVVPIVAVLTVIALAGDRGDETPDAEVLANTDPAATLTEVAVVPEPEEATAASAVEHTGTEPDRETEQSAPAAAAADDPPPGSDMEESENASVPLRLDITWTADWTTLELLAGARWTWSEVVDVSEGASWRFLANGEIELLLQDPVAIQGGTEAHVVLDLDLNDLDATDVLEFELERSDIGVVDVDYYNISGPEPVLVESVRWDGFSNDPNSFGEFGRNPITFDIMASEFRTGD